MMMILDRLVGDPTTTPNRKYFSVGYYVEYPTSLGFVHIKDGQDATVPPEFETGYLKACVPFISSQILDVRDLLS